MANYRGKRRDNGTGCLTQSGGKYIMKIQIGEYENGLPKYKTFSSKSRADAKRRGEEFLKTHNLSDRSYTSITLGDYMDSWMFNFKRNELKPQSYDKLDCTIRIHIKPEIGYLSMQSITTKDIQNLLNKKYKEEGLSYSSVKKIHDALNACFEFNLALSPQERILSYNPCRAAVIPGKQKENSVKEKHFTEEEILKIKEVVDSVDDKGRKIYPYGAAYIFLLNTGLRLSEFAALDKSDIDFENKCVFIRRM